MGDDAGGGVGGELQAPPRHWGISPAPLTTRVPHPVITGEGDGREINLARKLLFRSYSQHRRSDHVYVSALLKGVSPQAFAKLYEKMHKDRSLWPTPCCAPKWIDTLDLEHESGVVGSFGKQWNDREPNFMGRDRGVLVKPTLIYEPGVRFPQEFRTELDANEFEHMRRGWWRASWKSLPDFQVLFTRYMYCPRKRDTTPITAARYKRTMHFYQFPFSFHLRQYQVGPSELIARIAPRQYEIEILFRGRSNKSVNLPHGQVLAENMLRKMKAMIVQLELVDVLLGPPKADVIPHYIKPEDYEHTPDAHGVSELMRRSRDVAPKQSLAQPGGVNQAVAPLPASPGGVAAEAMGGQSNGDLGSSSTPPQGGAGEAAGGQIEGDLGDSLTPLQGGLSLTPPPREEARADASPEAQGRASSTEPPARRLSVSLEVDPARWAMATADSCDLEDDGEVEAFWDSWRERMEDWWLLTPHADGIGACVGALGVHLAQRLQRAYDGWRAHFLGAAGGGQSPTPNEKVAEGCEWVEESAAQLELPDFPAFPSAFELPALVPIPRLLPGLLDETSPLRLSRAPSGRVAQAATPHTAARAEPPTAEHRTAAPRDALLLGSAAGGALLSLSLLTAVLHVQRKCQRQRVAVRKQQPQLVVRAAAL